MTSHRARRFTMPEHDMADVPLEAFHAHVKAVPLAADVAGRFAALADATGAIVAAATPEPDLEKPGDSNVRAFPARPLPVTVEDRARAAANTFLRRGLPYRQVALAAVDGEPLVFVVVRTYLELRRWASALGVAPTRRRGAVDSGQVWDHARGTLHGATIDVTTDHRTQRVALQSDLAALAQDCADGLDVDAAVQTALAPIDSLHDRAALTGLVSVWAGIIAGDPAAVTDFYSGLMITAEHVGHARVCALTQVRNDVTAVLTRILGA